MRRRVTALYRSLSVRALIGIAVIGASAAPALAQTTVTLSDPSGEVVYATIRGGSYANTNLPSLLATRSGDNLEYERRALIKFDTQNAIPAGSKVTSAILTVTVKTGGSDATRNVAAYQGKTSWTENQVTWRLRRAAQPWVTGPGDLGTKIAQAVVGNKAGTRVSFDVTALVKSAVAGELGSSRYTRIALVDLDGSTSASYREYFTPSDSDASRRPTLKVTFGATKPAPAPKPKPAPTPKPTPAPPEPPSTSPDTSTLRVLHWNTHHGGVGTDGKRDPDRLTKWIAKINPDIVSLNEVERYTGWGNIDGPAVIASLLKQHTGKTWYYKFSTASGASNGNGNMVLSRFPFASTNVELLAHTRSAVDVLVYVNGRIINVTSTHLDADSTSHRLQQIGELTTWARTLAEQRIVCGDFNAWSGSSENATMKKTYYDSWAEAQGDNTDIAYPGNEAGNTRNSRIDYIYYSRDASHLELKSSQVFDTRDSKGIMPSDHRPLLSIFKVK
jgi:endonuclease/exonuclease/phosphatase family metal-dependent hydrolase